MKKALFCIAVSIFLLESTYGQVMVAPYGLAGSMPEHGFLPGKKFEFYPTINRYNFRGSRFHVEVVDDRKFLKLNKVQCSDIKFTNTSEFVDPTCVYMVAQYFDTLFVQAGAIMDLASQDTIRVRFEGIDARLIGFVSIRAHGLCQMTIRYHDKVKTYCIDITDADKHSPVSQYAFVTRKTATRIIASAAVREIVEQFFVDLTSYR